MHILVAVCRPADVHFYRHAIDQIRRRGHRVTVVARNHDRTVALLDAYDIGHTVLSPSLSTATGRVAARGVFAFRLLVHARRAQPDVMTAVGGSPLTYVASLVGARSVLFPDADRPQSDSALQFADEIHTPEGTAADFGNGHHRYEGFPELAAVHPDWFQPDQRRLRDTPIAPEEPYVLLQLGEERDQSERLPALSATSKRLLRSYLEDHATVYRVTDSGDIRTADSDRIYVSEDVRHDLMAFADLYVGHVRRRATETALVGTPALWVRPDRREHRPGPVADLEARGLLGVPDDDSALLQRVFDLVPNPASAGVWRQRRDRLVEESVDVTSYVVETLCAGVSNTGTKTTQKRQSSEQFNQAAVVE